MTATSTDQSEFPSVTPQAGGGRLVFVDVLRVAVIVGVIAHHAGQAYGPTSNEWAVTDTAFSKWFDPFFLVNAAFGMGLMMLLAGYFVPQAYDRKGAGQFFKERWLRIGVPMVVFMLVVQLPVVYLLQDPRLSAGEFVRSLWDSGWRDAYAHLWFLGHLLIYSAAYVAWRKVSERHTDVPQRTWALPTHGAIIGFVAALAFVTWVIRVPFPIDEWIPLFFVVAAEPAHLPQYVALFALGIVAYRGDWLRRLPTRMGMIWLGIGLLASAGVFAARALPPETVAKFLAFGGDNWQSLLYSTWEALICVGMVIGLIVFARIAFRRPNRLITVMLAGTYAAYILHIGIVIGLQLGIEGFDLPVFVKFGLVAAFGVLLSFGIGHLSRRVPGLNVILGTTPRDVEAITVHHEESEQSEQSRVPEISAHG
jgi:glucan biosynthesis protein C